MMFLGACTQRTLQDDSVWDAPNTSTTGTTPDPSTAGSTSGSRPDEGSSTGASPGFAETGSSGGPPVCVSPSPDANDVVVSVELQDLDPTLEQSYQAPCLLLQREGTGSEPTTFLFQCETLAPALSPILVVRVDAPGVVIPAEIEADGTFDVRFVHWRHPTNPYRLADDVAISRDGALLYAAAAGSHVLDDALFSPFGVSAHSTECLEEPPLECHDRLRGELDLSLGDAVESIPDFSVAKAFDYDVQVGQMYVSDGAHCGELAKFWMAFAMARG